MGQSLSSKRTLNTLQAKGLPANENAEKMILGSILLDDSKFASVVGAIQADSFSLQKHRLIWQRMTDLAVRSEKIDRVTVANELLRYDELELVDGLSYLVTLDDGLPWVSNIDAYVRIIIEKSRLRKAIYAAQRTMNQALSGEYNADEVVKNGQTMLVEDSGGYGSSQIESVRQFVETYPGGINMFLDPSRADRGIPTGLSDFDEVTDGFHAGEIFLIGARPASGKTAIGANIAKTVARSGRPVAIFSLEISKQMYLQRMICEEAFVSYSRFRRGDMDDEDRRRVRAATSTVMEMPMYIDDTSSLSMADMRVQVNRIQDEIDSPLALAVTDYAQLIKPPKGIRFGTENDKFTAIGEGVKHFCKETRIPMLLLSQLNRESEREKGDARPKLAQCRGAGIWEEISFVGACLYREVLRKRDRDDLREQAELLIEKNRSGPATTVTLRFQPWLMRFSTAIQNTPPTPSSSV